MSIPATQDQATAILFERYSSNQHAIARSAVASISGAWDRMITPESFNASWHRLEPLLVGIIEMHYRASAADASDYYSSSRAVAGFYGGSVPYIGVNDDYLAAVTNMRGVGMFFHYLDAGDDAETASKLALEALQGAATRVILNGGRDTVMTASSLDRNSLGWERIIESDACQYCSMLAGSVTVQKVPAADKAFHAHDLCHCLARTVFVGQQTANNQIRSEWNVVTAGKSGKAAEAAWNQYWSDRNVEPQPEGTGEPAQVRAGNAAVAEEQV